MLDQPDEGQSSTSKTHDLTYIVDEPAAEDHFGAHSSIAEAIVSTIEKQQKIRLVGLLGRWGTGKSTIISQLATIIEARYKQKYILFAYDAWAHQGDPARRSILEELIAWLVNAKSTLEAEWHETLLEISGSTESASTTTKTHLSGWGKLIFIELLLLPILASIVDGDTLRDAFKETPDDLALFLIRVTAVYLVIIFGTIFAAYASTKNYRALVDPGFSIPNRLRRFASSGDDILSLMLTRQFPGSSSTTLRKSQPTAIEFRRYLRRIVESQRPRRLIFVIDNLDRIDPTEALNVWSIMVGMVADESHRIDPEIEPIVLLPFDQTALENIAKTGSDEPTPAAELIEKSFDVTFEVPPPVLSDWRLYFSEQYKRCGLHGANNGSTFEEYWTVRGFEKFLGSSRVTPRKINKFLNRIISLSQQQIELFSPSILAFYIANESAIQANCLAFLSNAKPGFDESRSWQLKVAAIAFGTTEAEAAQVLLRDRLSSALRERNQQEFDQLTHVSGSRDVLRNLVEDPPRNPSATIDAKPLTALAAFAFQSEENFDDQVFWLRLFSAWKSADFGDDPDPLTPDAIRAFITILPDVAVANTESVTARLVSEIDNVSDPEKLKQLASRQRSSADGPSKRIRIHRGDRRDVGTRPSHPW